MADSRQLPVRARPGGRTADHTARIIETTMALLVEGGMDALSFQAVAERAGVARATMYRRWPSAAHLADDAIRITAADQIVMRDTGTLAGDLTDALAQIGRFISTPLGRAALIAGIHMHAAPDEGVPDSWERRWTDVAPIFERAEQRGELAATVDAEALFASISGSLYFRTIVMGREIDDNWIRRVLATVIGDAVPDEAGCAT